MGRARGHMSLQARVLAVASSGTAADSPLDVHPRITTARWAVAHGSAVSAVSAVSAMRRDLEPPRQRVRAVSLTVCTGGGLQGPSTARLARASGYYQRSL